MAEAGKARVGKRVGGAVYIHRDAILHLSEGERERLMKALAHFDAEPAWNVARIGSTDVSLLEYEDFSRVAFPHLLASTLVKLADGEVKQTSYRARASRPILHRKELLLAPGDPRTPKFAALTRFAEEKGLFKNSNAIGSSGAWAKLLEAAGLEIAGADLIEKGATQIAVERHRTALVRRSLSQPMALALRLGMISNETRVFDYGCGQGDDVAILNANGFDAFGWDPHFATDGRREAADLVNLGFVLNVIENPTERVETLRAAWGFAKRALVIAVMNRASFAGSQTWRPYKDGVVTSRGTFQRYFSQDEIRALVEMTLNQRAVTLAPGIVAVFRDSELEQEVSFRRRSSAIQYFARPLEAPERAARPKVAAPDLGERLGTIVEDIWRVALKLGRTPSPEELGEEILAALRERSISAPRAVATAIARAGEGDALARIAQARREDLLVHFALSLFPGAPKYASLPRTLQLDVRAFFASHTGMMGEARAFLFALGKGEIVRAGAAEALARGHGQERGPKFRFAATGLTQMPASIRLLIGCAEVLEPELASADFYDVYLSGGRVRGIWCEDADARCPIMRELRDVELVKLKVRRHERAGEAIYGRGAMLSPDHPERAEQLAFDETLVARGIVDETGHGPDAAAFAKLDLG